MEESLEAAMVARWGGGGGGGDGDGERLGRRANDIGRCVTAMSGTAAGSDLPMR